MAGLPVPRLCSLPVVTLGVSETLRNPQAKKCERPNGHHNFVHADTGHNALCPTSMYQCDTMYL